MEDTHLLQFLRLAANAFGIENPDIEGIAGRRTWRPGDRARVGPSRRHGCPGPVAGEGSGVPGADP